MVDEADPDRDGRPGVDEPPALRAGGKSPTAFRTISEVSQALDVPAHVLRFWETRFSQLRPLKRAGGRRYYRPEDVELLARIRGLLYDNGYTIRGVQRLLRDGPSADESAPPPGEIEPDREDAAAIPEEPPPDQELLRELLDELVAIRDLLRQR